MPFPALEKASIVERMAALLDALPPLPVPPPSQPAAAMAAPAAPAAGTPPPGVDTVRQTTKKFAKRAAVRRAQRLSAPAAPDATASGDEVLVLDADPVARQMLLTLLQAFGFRVQATGDTRAAAALVALRSFAAVFVDVPLDGSDGGAGIDLCQQIQETGRLRGGTAPLLVLVAAQLRPIDRVRADLAGFAQVIVKPVTRGAVAGALDSHGIALPADARRT